MCVYNINGGQTYYFFFFFCENQRFIANRLQKKSTRLWVRTKIDW
jgi:hypothetical protein